MNIPDDIPETIAARVGRARRLWLFLDYDGTLAEFAPNPDVIKPDPYLADLLGRLAGHPDVRLGVLSGRRLDHVLALLPVEGAVLAGTYGVELRTPEGERVARLDYDKIRPALQALKPRWADLISDREGYYLEDKGWTLALHGRHSADPRLEQVLDQARRWAAEAADPEVFRLIGGYKFVEIGPIEADKGWGVHHLLSRYPWDGALPVFLGDDDKDEDAFRAIREHGGVPLVVTAEPRETLALGRLRDPAQVHAWLEALLANRPVGTS